MSSYFHHMSKIIHHLKMAVSTLQPLRHKAHNYFAIPCFILLLSVSSGCKLFLVVSNKGEMQMEKKIEKLEKEIKAARIVCCSYAFGTPMFDAAFSKVKALNDKLREMRGPVEYVSHEGDIFSV
jgi:hypothetical protein